MDYTTIGIDVSKSKLDICFLISGETMTISNDIKGYGLLLKHIKKNYNVKKVIIEHTGNYQKNVVSYLQKNKFKVCVVNPTKVRNFAKACGIMAKTDKIDAQIIAKYGEVLDPEETIEREDKINYIKELVNFRKGLVEMIKEFKVRLEKKPASYIAKEIKESISHLVKQQSKIEKEIIESIKKQEVLAKKYEILEKITGFGPQTVTVLLSYLPELGKLERNKIASLCGVAPMNRDSGKRQGIRSIYGGRKIVRDSLYMAAVSATKHNKVIREHYLSLKAKGKPSKVALVACMRKLIIFANSLLKNF